MNAHDLVQEIIERKGKIENVFWIACGGSMIDLMPANELLKREATTFTSTVYTAREFCLMAEPWREVARYCLQPQRQHAGGRRRLRDGATAGARSLPSPTARAQDR
ncbi:MAG: hypothetical protein ACLUQW_07680 [Collinsella sp.]